MSDARTNSSAIDRENPWPGLASFTEEARAFFFGREKETDELVRLVRRNTLTVLFGQSGLGKSSLLQAGAFPVLREADFLPLYLRLDHSEAAPVLAEQVKVALVDAFKAVGADAPAPRADESLWEYFHRKDIDIWSAKNRLLTPVLAFDQFEEIFTLGRASEGQRERGRAFLAELADLVENRPPAALRAKFDAGELDPARYAFDKPSCQVILSLREDFLPDLEGLKNEMRSIMHSRMRVRRLNGTQALEIVTRPAPQLLAEGVAERIVEFVAGARGGSAERLTELEVEPALLSVICRELNERRRMLGQPQITAEQVSGNRREILTDFYERSVADLPEAMRALVEDRLLTKSGFRDNLALESALETPGVTRALIDTLVSRRLLRLEDRQGTQRVELTHDVLAEVIRGSRDARQQRFALAESAQRARRQRWVIAGLGAVVAALIVGAFFGIRAQRRAERAQREQAAQASRTDFVFGSRLLEEHKTPEGLAFLVRAARTDPANLTVGPRLISALVSGSFAEPVGVPLAHPTALRWAGYAPDGRHALTWNDGVCRYWDLANGRLLQTFQGTAVNATFAGCDLSPDGRRFAVGTSDAKVNVWDLETGRAVFVPLPHPQRIHQVSYSPDNRWLVTSCADNVVRIWDAATGKLHASFPAALDFFGTFAISRDSARVVAGPGEIYLLSEGTHLSAVPAGGGSGVRISPDSSVFTLGRGTRFQLYNATTGAPVGAPMNHGDGQSTILDFSRDGTKVVTYSTDGKARLWAVPSGNPLGVVIDHGAVINYASFAADDRLLITAGGDGSVRIWSVATGRLAMEPIRAGDIRSFEVSPDGREVITVGRDGFARRWRLAPGALAPMELALSPSPLAVQRDAGGAPHAWALYADRAQKYDLGTGERLGAEIIFPVAVTGPVLSPNGRFMVVTTPERTRELWTLGEPAIGRRPLGDARTVGGTARFSRDSSVVEISNANAGLRIWSTASGDPVAEAMPGRDANFARASVPYSPTDRYLATKLFAENTFALFDLQTRRLSESILHPGPIWGMGFSPDERWVATVSGGLLAVRIWEVASGRQVGESLPHRSVTRGATFSRDGRELLTWERQGAHLWDVATGRKQVSFKGGFDIDPAIFSPDERRVATAANGEIRLFDRASGAQLTEPMEGAAITTGSNWQTISFTADGKFLIAVKPGSATTLRLWPLPPHQGGPAPQWLLRLATALAGGEIDGRGSLTEQQFEAGVFDDVRAELAALPVDAPYVEWGRWFLADRATRPIGPGLKITAAEAEKLRAGAER